MKVLNIIDIGLVSSFLRRYYTDNNIEFDFLGTEKDLIIESIDKGTPDFIVIQDNYVEFSGLELIQYIRDNAKAGGRGAKYIYLSTTTEDNSKDIKRDNDIVDVTVNIRDFDGVMNKLIEAQVLEAKIVREKSTGESRNHTILFVDDSVVMHTFMKQCLGDDKDDKYRLISAYDGIEGFEVYNRILPNMVITDIEMPNMNGLELCKKIKENNDGRYIPVIIVSSRADELTIDQAFDYGADDYLTKPVDEVRLKSLVEDHFQNLERKRKNKILVADGNKIIQEIVQHAFLKNSYNVITAASGDEVMKVMKRDNPEVLVIDIAIPGLDCYKICEHIRNDEELKDTSIIIMSSKSNPKDQKRLSKFGISKYFVKPFDVEKMVIMVDQLLLEKYHVYEKEYEYMLFSIKSLVKALEARDKYTKGHTDRVTELAVELGRYMKLGNKFIETLEISASLHDIGKIGISDSILLKPGKLNDAEYEIIKSHPVLGAEILKPIKSLQEITTLILMHHERWDGKGYPSGAVGESIPLGARILAVVDAYDAITSDRPYRGNRPHGDALKIISENAGTQFCPACADAFISMMVEKRQ